MQMSTQNKDNSTQQNDNQFIRGRNWGELNIVDKELVFKGDDKPWFNLPISSLANVVQTSNKNEIGLEFNMDDENQNDFLLCEMRFFLPEEKQEHKDKKDSPEENEEEEPEEEKEQKLSYAETLKQQLTKIVNIGNVSNSIARLPEIQMITPRGKFDLYFMENFVKIHGASHNYKIVYKNISKVFLVPKIDGHNHFFVVSLKQPINQGNTSYPFLIFQLKDEMETSVELQIPEKMKDYIDLPNPLEGPIKDVLANLFTQIIKIGIIIPSKNFTFTKGSCIKCFNKASEGAIYPMEKCILFLHKPVICINHEDIRQVSLSRIDDLTMAQRSFDLKIETKTGEVPFSGFEKEELEAIMNYFNSKKIKLIQIDEANNQLEPNPGVSSRRQRAVVNEKPMELPSEESIIGDDDYSDEEEDEGDDEEDDEDEDEEEESSHKKEKKKSKK